MAKEFKLPYTASEINEKLKKIDNKADLVDGKIPTEQLPDYIGGEINVEDIKGLLTEETFTTMSTLWEYSEDMVADTVVEAISAQFYRFSDNTNLGSLIGVTITDTEGNIVKTTSEMVDSSTGLFHSINLPPQGLCCMIIVPNDFDLSVVGGSGMALAGSYAARNTSGEGALKIQTETEVTKSSISTELLPSALQIGETGTKIEWDGTPTDDFIDDLGDILGVYFYKVGNSISIENIIGSTITAILSGEEISLTISENIIIPLNDECYLIMESNGQVYGFVSLAETSVNLLPIVGADLILNVPTDGLWFLYGDDNNHTKAFFGTDYQVKQLDSKYIPTNLDFDLSDYYTKDEVDDSISSAISRIDFALTSAIGSGVLS